MNCKKRNVSALGSLLFLILMFSSGCATYEQGMKQAIVAMAKGDYTKSAELVEKNIGKKGKERLIYAMELGLVKHLDGKYEESNRLLENASVIAEEFETKRIGDLFKSAATNPRMSPYRGTKFEKIFIHYYKALNYLKLAVREPLKKDDYIEAARIEGRRIDIKLTAIEKKEGSYQDAKDKKKKFFGKLMQVFNTLEGKLDKDKLIYREDAYIRYLTGLVYEQNGELDEARIAYHKSALLYESGFSEQYDLGNEITQIAWFDTIRVMRDSGGWEDEWSELAEKKLSPELRKKLDHFKPGTGQLLIIQGTGRVPGRDELNLRMTLDIKNKALVLRPFLTGSAQVKRDQAAWFSSMYSEKGMLSIVSNYMSRGAHGAVEGLTSKRLSLSAVWPLVESIGLPSTMQVLGPLGIRVTVPYYRPSQPDILDTFLWVDGEKVGKLANAESIATLAVNEQFMNADSDLKAAIVREISKTSVTKYGGPIGGLLSAITSAAETRNWLTLPYFIKISRIALPPGKHEVKIISHSTKEGVSYEELIKEIEIEDGKIAVWSSRILNPLTN